MADVEKEPVVVAPYDPRWPLLYDEERVRIVAALGGRIAAVEHVGSTAVPGLGAKPIIDVMVGLRCLADSEGCIPILERLGYEYKGEFGIPGRLYFRRSSEGKRTHQVHIVEEGSNFWELLLLFRDYLREHPEEAQEYCNLKERLAARFRSQRAEYTKAKTEFIAGVIAKARRAKQDQSAG